MEVKLISHIQKLHCLQNLVQVLTRSTIATLRKLSHIGRKLLYHTTMRAEKNRRFWSIYPIDMRRFPWPENRSGNFFTTRAKSMKWVCTKQYDRLFPEARSHSQQMGKRLWETKVQRIVRNKVKKWIRKWKGIRKYHDQVSFINNETFTCCVVNRLLQSVNFVTRKINYFSRLESIRNICCCRRWLNRSSYRYI